MRRTFCKQLSFTKDNDMIREVHRSRQIMHHDRNACAHARCATEIAKQSALMRKIERRKRFICKDPLRLASEYACQ